MSSDFLEKKLEDLIFENRKSISSRGLDIFYPNAVRQLRLPEGFVQFHFQKKGFQFRSTTTSADCPFLISVRHQFNFYIYATWRLKSLYLRR